MCTSLLSSLSAEHLTNWTVFVTIFQIPLEQAQSYLDQLAQQELQQPDFKKLSDSKKWSHASSLPTTPEPTVERPARIGNFSISESFSPNSSVESL